MKRIHVIILLDSMLLLVTAVVNQVLANILRFHFVLDKAAIRVPVKSEEEVRSSFGVAYFLSSSYIS